MTVTSEPVEGALLDARYRLRERVGTGGMAHVFRADDLALGRSVAVKILHAHGAAQAGEERIRGEVELLASVSSHSLVTLLDARVAGEQPSYLVMEYVDGPTLSGRLRHGALPLSQLDDLAEDLAEALLVVHGAGIVHRDVKPSNVLLAMSGSPLRPFRAKLADFGIAHLLDSTRVTTPGLTIGTAAYIAPELLDGADPAPPSDIYALGLVLLEAATGRRPFDTADARAQVLARMMRDPDIPASLGPERRVLLAAMTARDPQDRPDAGAVLAALAALPPADAIDLEEMTAPIAVAVPPSLRSDARRRTSEATPTLPYAHDAAIAALFADAEDSPETQISEPRTRSRRRATIGAGVAAAAVLIVSLTAFTWPHAEATSSTVDPTPSASPSTTGTADDATTVADDVPLTGEPAPTEAAQNGSDDTAGTTEVASVTETTDADEASTGSVPPGPASTNPQKGLNSQSGQKGPNTPKAPETDKQDNPNKGAPQGGPGAKDDRTP